MQVGAIAQLLEDEIGYVSAGDLELDAFVMAGKAVAILASAIAVNKGARTNQGPVELTFLHILLLALVVGKDLAQQETEHEVFPVEIEVAPAVACAQGGLADKALDVVLFHGADDLAGACGADGAGEACTRAQDADDGVLALNGLFHGSEVEDIAFHNLEVAVGVGELCAIASKGGDNMPLL